MNRRTWRSVSRRRLRADAQRRAVGRRWGVKPSWRTMGMMRSALSCGALVGLVACGDGGEGKPDDGETEDASVEDDGSAESDAGPIAPCTAG
jgi:hypothetical protein